MLRFAALITLALLYLSTGVLGSPTPSLDVAGHHHKRTGRCEQIRVRKEWRALTSTEKQQFITAVQCFQNRTSTIVHPGVKSRFDEFQATHIDLTDEVHQVGHFLAWHRHFITMFHAALREECGFTGTLPYWNWSIDADSTKAMKDSPIFDPTTGFGGDGVSGTYTLPPDPNGQSSAFPFAYKGCVRTGPFANQIVRLGPGKLVTEHCLVRGVDETSKTALKSAQVERVMQQTPFERFRTSLENGMAGGGAFGIHGGGHSAVGGEMLNPYSSPGGFGGNGRGPTQRPPFTNVTFDFMMTFTTLGPKVAVRDVMETETEPSCFIYQ